MFKRLTWNADIPTVARVITIPKQYATTTLLISKWANIVKLSGAPEPPDEKIRLTMKTMTELAPRPSTTPTAPETIE
tara:strand:+ start:286 stop:516 length:231 start_codon:yes stop_codon:yes gene_type:complete